MGFLDIGVGLFVAQAVEFTMAVQIARLEGLNFSDDNYQEIKIKTKKNNSRYLGIVKSS